MGSPPLSDRTDTSVGTRPADALKIDTYPHGFQQEEASCRSGSGLWACRPLRWLLLRHPDGGQSVLMPCGVCCSAVAQAQRASVAGFPWRRCYPAPAPAPSSVVTLWSADGSVQRVVGSRQVAVSLAPIQSQQSQNRVPPCSPPGQSRLRPTLRQTSSPQAPRPGTARPQPGWRRVSTLVRAIWKDAVHAQCGASIKCHTSSDWMRCSAEMSPASSKSRWRWKQTGLRQTARAGLVRCLSLAR